MKPWARFLFKFTGGRLIESINYYQKYSNTKNKSI